MPLPLPLRALIPAVLLVGAVGVRAQRNNNNNNNNTAVGVGFVVAAVFLFIVCCGLARRRMRRARTPAALPTIVLSSSGTRFPRVREYWPQPQPQPYNNTSEYPPMGPGAEMAPPPYVKEGTGYSPSPGPPPPDIDAPQSPAYSPPPDPPPRAHIASNSADFNGGFHHPLES